jgi:predicted metal-dependent hydrolase
VRDFLRVGAPAIPVRLRRSVNARRLTLRVTGDGRPPAVTAPPSAPLGEIERFLTNHEAWLRRQLSERPPVRAVALGGVLPVRGREVALRIGPHARLDSAAGALVLPGPEWRLPAQAAAFIRALAREAVVEATGRFAAALGRPHGRITLRDPRSRWGSCSARGDLMYSWRLAMAPPEVLDYVAAHEVAHLAELNHSPRFWAVVAQLYPGHAAARAWLRRDGAALHRFDFRRPQALEAM